MLQGAVQAIRRSKHRDLYHASHWLPSHITRPKVKIVASVLRRRHIRNVVRFAGIIDIVRRISPPHMPVRLLHAWLYLSLVGTAPRLCIATVQSLDSCPDIRVRLLTLHAFKPMEVGCVVTALHYGCTNTVILCSIVCRYAESVDDAATP